MVSLLSFGRVHAVSDLFTDRIEESAALAASLLAHQRSCARPAVGARQAENVLVFHGIGGIGKTTLSHRLEAWLRDSLPDEDDWGKAPLPRVAAIARYDLHDSKGNVDVAAVVLALRRALSEIKPKWPAFDFAFTAWWTAYRRDNSEPVLHGRPDTALKNSLLSTLADVVNDLGTPNAAVNLTLAATRKAVQLYSQHQDRQLASTIVQDQVWYCDLLERLSLLPSPDDPRPDLLLEAITLLDLELASLPACPQVVMFVDTFENVQNPDDSERRAEGFFQELIWNMPHILFVLTGRNSLQWAREKRTSLPHDGPRRWPGLTPNATCDPRQHRVGRLSHADSIEFLNRARSSQDLPLSDQDIEQIAAHTDGLPKHIDLILAEIYEDLADGYTSFDRKILTTTFDELVGRLLRDIPTEEQRVLRAAALFTSFDEEILIAASEQEAGCVLRALQRPLVDAVKNAPLPYRMHDTVRRAIRQYDPLAPGGWAPADWKKAASKALDYYKSIIETALSNNNSLQALQYIGAAITLVCEEDIQAPQTTPESAYPDWLTEKVVKGPGIGALRPHVPTTSSTDYGQTYLDFITAKHNQTPIREGEKILNRIAHTNHPLALPAARHHAYSLRSQERFTEAIQAFDHLLENHPSTLHSYQRQLTLSIARQFHDAVVNAQEQLGDAPPRLERVKARSELSHGLPESFHRSSQQVFSVLESAGRTREAFDHRFTSFYYHALCSSRPIPPSQDEYDVAINSTDFTIEATGRATSVLLDPFSQDASAHLEGLKALDDNRLHTLSPWHGVARCAFLWAREQEEELRGIAQILLTQRHQSMHWIPVEILLNHLGYPVDIPPAQWLEPYDTVQQRWLTHWHNWHKRVTTQQEN